MAQLKARMQHGDYEIMRNWVGQLESNILYDK